MRNILRFMTVVGQAALLLTLAFFVTAWIAVPHLSPSNVNKLGGKIALIAAFIIPLGVAFWWMFHKLQSYYSRREALAASVAFAVVAPVPLAIGLVLGTTVGRSYADVIFRTQSRAVAFTGAVAGTVVIIILMALIMSALALWITRLTIKRGFGMYRGYR